MSQQPPENFPFVPGKTPQPQPSAPPNDQPSGKDVAPAYPFQPTKTPNAESPQSNAPRPDAPKIVMGSGYQEDQDDEPEITPPLKGIVIGSGYQEEDQQYEPQPTPGIVVGSPPQDPGDYRPEPTPGIIVGSPPQDPTDYKPDAPAGIVVGSPPQDPGEYRPQTETAPEQADEAPMPPMEADEEDVEANLRAMYAGEQTDDPSKAPGAAEAAKDAYKGAKKSEAEYSQRDAVIDEKLENLKKGEWSNRKSASVLLGSIAVVVILLVVMAKVVGNKGPATRVELSEEEYRQAIGHYAYQRPEGEFLGTILKVNWVEEGGSLGKFPNGTGGFITEYAPESNYYFIVKTENGERPFIAPEVETMAVK